MNELSIFQWIIIFFGAGVFITGARILMVVGEKLKEIDVVKESITALRDETRGALKNLKDDVALRAFCILRHDEIDKRFKTGDKKFEKLDEKIDALIGMVARIDERTAKWPKE